MKNSIDIDVKCKIDGKYYRLARKDMIGIWKDKGFKIAGQNDIKAAGLRGLEWNGSAFSNRRGDLVLMFCDNKARLALDEERFNNAVKASKRNAKDVDTLNAPAGEGSQRIVPLMPQKTYKKRPSRKSVEREPKKLIVPVNETNKSGVTK